MQTMAQVPHRSENLVDAREDLLRLTNTYKIASTVIALNAKIDVGAQQNLHARTILQKKLRVMPFGPMHIPLHVSNRIRSSPARAMKRLPLARPIRVRPVRLASSTPQAVKPEREISTGIPICTVFSTISLVNRPVV